MGNSGSVHHMQSGLKELHSYYQVHGNCEGIDDLSFLNEEQKAQFNEECSYLESNKSLPRSKFSRIPSATGKKKVGPDATARNAQLKVLPTLSQHLRLRSTTNGAILHSGGTISGRKESLFPQPMVRSKTFVRENSDEAVYRGSQVPPPLTRRSQTQLTIDLKRNSISNVNHRSSFHDKGIPYRRYSSKMDIQDSSDILEAEQTASVSNSSETNQKLSKVKIKNKKRKAPPVPPSSNDGKTPDLVVSQPGSNFSHQDSERKQRMFKTKSEMVFQTSGASYLSRQPQREQKPPVKLNSHGAAEKVKAPLCPKVNQRLPQPEVSGFRREKSFDATVLSWRKSTNTGRVNCSGSIKRKSLQVSEAPFSPTKPSISNDKIDFKVELQAATKRHLITKNLHLSELRTSSKEASERQRETSLDKLSNLRSKNLQKTLKHETQSKIPQLKKTFYFGMEKAKGHQNESSQKQLNTVQSDVKAVSSPIVEEKNKDEMDCGSSESTVYTVGQKYSSKINDNGIQVNVRPTLPRRQLEIPRFSPIAAWRTLTEEYRKQTVEAAESPNSSSSPLEVSNIQMMEDRIYRTYREPCPFYQDNKSGDSGISGDDAYLPEKPIQPRNFIRNECDEMMAFNKLNRCPVEENSQPPKVVGPFLTPWTPQQDLDDEDTSSDGDLAVKLIESRNPISAHVFSLSLPRENQNSLYGEKGKPEFRSLQKLKRSASGEFNNSTCECTHSSDSNICSHSCLGNYRSDNWLLSKTGTGANAGDKKVPSSNQADSQNKSTFMDWSAFIKPMSIGCLASGKHLMYLPNRPICELKRQSIVDPPNSRDHCENINSLDDFNSKNARTRNKRFSFQSSVRQIERRRIAEKLSRDAEQKEALRKSELEVMRRVEEEFQRKRACEKASIRHQLRLYSMNDDNFTSLPTDYTAHCSGYRAEPDGAVSSTSDSPILRMRDDTKRPDNNNEYCRSNNDLSMIFAHS